MKRIIFAVAAVAAAACVVLPTAAMAQVDVNLVVGNAPPPPRSERVPAPRRGYVWAPGYWNWNGARHEWSDGHWEVERRGQIYHPAQWRQDHDGWHFVSGGFDRAYVEVAPPPPRMEAIPAPRRGYVWAPGHWEWQRNRHMWVGGLWVREQRGYHYQPHSWVQRDGHWVMEGGQWSRGDQDHDGIPNGRDHDRDGDGRPNSQDRYPDNPRRN